MWGFAYCKRHATAGGRVWRARGVSLDFCKKLPICRADWAFHMAYIADLRGWRGGSIFIFCGSGIRIARGPQGEDVGVFPPPTGVIGLGLQAARRAATPPRPRR